MPIPIEVIRELEIELPSVDDFMDMFIRKDFEYDNNLYSIYFYKVKDYGNYFGCVTQHKYMIE